MKHSNNSAYDTSKDCEKLVFMNTNYFGMKTDFGPEPYVTNVPQKAMKNFNFRTALWTGNNMQMTLMCIPVCADIGDEVHEDTDQIIRIEQGMALVKMGENKCHMDFQVEACKGDTIFVPTGTWHNIVNIGKIPLKLSTIYAPPHHPMGTVHRTKADAQSKYK